MLCYHIFCVVLFVFHFSRACVIGYPLRLTFSVLFHPRLAPSSVHANASSINLMSSRSRSPLYPTSLPPHLPRTNLVATHTLHPSLFRRVAFFRFASCIEPQESSISASRRVPFLLATALCFVCVSANSCISRKFFLWRSYISLFSNLLSSSLGQTKPIVVNAYTATRSPYCVTDNPTTDSQTPSFLPS